MIQTIQRNLKQEIKLTYLLPLPELIFKAQSIHREFHNPNEVQFCTLSNIKSGACPEDCSYCSQSARYDTESEVYSLMNVEKVLAEAKEAKANGATRFCMGAAWRSAPDNYQFENVLEMVRAVKEMNMEPCVTLGMLKDDQAQRLKEAGLHSYNHNIDTSREHYANVITTRTFDDRLNTIKLVQEAGINVCCGGILGLGETREDRFSFIETLAELNPQPASVPINLLAPIEGTPMYETMKENPIDKFELVRTIATTRIMIPEAQVRLSAGRLDMSEELQAMCFIAGANSIFSGDKLLTTDNPSARKDFQLMDKLGMQIRQTVSEI
ncbi:MAG: biotin synthase BioB [Candidatus Melainabacteria bacterium]|nr:biotin synthase BioB [Candidatus Melainabacteria bacterium]